MYFAHLITHRKVQGLILVILILIGTGFYIAKSQMANSGTIACTMEAMLCPDGSYVGRTGPKCEFSPCPTITITNDSGITGIVILGPTCPVMRDPPDPQCADRPFGTNLVVTKTNSTKVVATFTSGQDGKFKVKLPFGDYEIHSSGPNILPRCGVNSPVKVISAQFTDITVYCDTGIR